MQPTCVTSFVSSLANSAGFHKAPRASINPFALVISTALLASANEKTSPFSSKGNDVGIAARRSLITSHCAQNLGRSVTRRQWTATASTPQDSIKRTNSNVFGNESRMRILQVTARRPPKLRTRVVRMSRIRSGCVSNAEPIPP
eukprot:scaffold36224_cov36-Tisochrysis_lutea.AAC.2